MFAYYSYFGRARAGQIMLIETDMQRIAELQVAASAEDDAARGAGKAAARAPRQSWSRRASKRSRVLAILEVAVATSAQVLERLQQPAGGLETLLRDCMRAIRAFSQSMRQRRLRRLRGRLAWPVGGHLAAHFGQVRVGGV